MFQKVLVANRGEIAVRVIRALREMGIASCAVYSEADRKALHVLLADEATPIGPPPAAESYLAIDRILEAARRVGAEAVHPGYGFLAENPEFASACGAEGLRFIGPPPEAIAAMGDKAEAKAVVATAGVPVVPGSAGPVGDEEARHLAREIGYPVLLKAAKGGGGKGMRAVHDPGALEAALRLTRGEAQSAFGSPEILVEKLLVRPRHVEAQILADEHGRTLFVGERECSIQRRHQKVIEEAPSPSIDGERRAELAEIAVKAAEAVGYRNAGTVEFLLSEGGDLHFLEMNTRLQVEHPVTELTTGVDLVKEQVRIAAGEPITLPARLDPRGHAIEGRIYAEDPSRGFLPSTGTIRFLREAAGPGLRNDSGIYEGFTIPVHYDPMLAKLIAWGQDREEARRRLRAGLLEYRIEGLSTNITFLRWILEEADFRENHFHVGWLEAEHPRFEPPGRGFGKREAIAAIAATLHAHFSAGRRAPAGASARAEHDGLSPWVRVGRARRLGRTR